MKQLCQPKKFKPQPSQKLVADFIAPNSPYNSLLVFHQIGSGKTCTAITAAEKFKNKRKILVLVPASLIDNFRDELRTPCGNFNYISKSDYKLLQKLSISDPKYDKIIQKSNSKIAKVYNILSYHKFVQLALDKKINLKNTLLIVDEVQNMVSESGTFYKVLKSMIDKAPKDLKILLLSATPIFDRPQEIALTLNLLRPTTPFPTSSKFVDKYIVRKQTNNKVKYYTKNLNHFKQNIKGLISYYRGADPISYPNVNFKVKRITMNDFQHKSYLAALSDDENFIRGAFKSDELLGLPSNFGLGLRITSNIAFPNKCSGFKGLSCFKGDCLELQNLKNYSIKFYHIIKQLKKSIGPCFIYSNFKTYGGLEALICVLNKHGWKDFKTYGEGPKRYAIWSGDEKITYKALVKNTFNQKSNSDGSKLHIVLGSPSIKEGVTLKRLDQMHIIEPYWNMSRMLQIIGRGVRYCSHNDLPKKRQIVNIFLYIAKTQNDRESIDEYIWSMAKNKAKLINKFETVMKQQAIDCQLFFNANYNPKVDEEKPQCFI